MSLSPRGGCAGSLLVLSLAGLLVASPVRAAPAAGTAPAPFVWAARVDGVDQPAGGAILPAGLRGWACRATVDAVEVDGPVVGQFGVLRCEGGDGAAVETTVFCRTSPQTPTDSGAGTLVLRQGGRDVSLELRCASPGAPGRPRLHLDPTLPASTHSGVPTVREAPTAGRYRWQLSGADGPVVVPGAVPTSVAGWACAMEVSGVTDPTYGYSEYATFGCGRGGLQATTLVPCVRAASDAHTCQAGALRIEAASGAASWMLLCEDLGNPGCF